ncbi:MAG: hypothetical protein V4642_15170 [Bacteroidota bacterium]
MKYLFILLTTSLLIFTSCDEVKQKTKSAINKTGETVAKGTSEFVNGVSKGIDETYESKVEISQDLKSKGLDIGKFKITDRSDSAQTLSAYLITNKDINDTLLVKVFDKEGREYGRSLLSVNEKSGMAKYYDFPFEKQVNIESKSTFIIE